MAVIIYVDDILICKSNRLEIQYLKSHLHSLYIIKDMGLAKYFLGVEINQTAEGISISQSKYILDMLQDAKLQDCKLTPSPFLVGTLLHLAGKALTDLNQYRRLVVKLFYLGLIRPDISFITQQLSQYIQEPQEHHFQVALHVLKYLKGTSNNCLFYSAKVKPQFTAFYDSDWGTCQITRKSTTGFCIMLGTSLISWKTKK